MKKTIVELTMNELNRETYLNLFEEFERKARELFGQEKDFNLENWKLQCEVEEVEGAE